MVLLVETLAALLPPGPETAAPSARPPSVAVLVPAHNEEAQIAETVRLLLTQLPERGRLIVVADNCADDTAAVAARAGATVIERTDSEHVGKGFAISFGLDHLAPEPPEVVILVDADCRVSESGLAALAAAAALANRPIQAEYLLAAPSGAGAMVVVSALATLLRNRVRPRGLRRLGLPCHLTGSGMAFPWRVLREAPAMGANLVEDLVLGIELALRGTPAQSCAEVRISSDLPRGEAANLGQRRRWEHGQLHTLASYAPRLIGKGIAGRRLDLLGLGLDLAVPPLALLVMMQVAMLLVSGSARWIGVASFEAFGLALLAVACLSGAVAAAWIGFGRQVLPLCQVLFVPLYLLWKVPLYLGLARGKKQAVWERTARDGEAPSSIDAERPSSGA
jgi:cellulose synthase/poly-beta-1,6-N-acetylglucosamine synthase-like glycosyltransferase